MKSRIYKSLFVLMAIAMVIDWPVNADAGSGKAVREAAEAFAKEAKHSSFFSRCTNQTEQRVNQATQKAENMSPRTSVVVGKTLQKANASARNRNQSGVCGRCSGSGQIYYNGEAYYCPNCNGSGRSY